MMEVSMNLTGKVSLLVLGFAVMVSSTSAEPTTVPQYDKAEIQSLIRLAHTSEQYRTLAGYFRARQKTFEGQAEVEKEEWVRRSQNVTGPSAKYPRPVDSSKNRYEYFTYRADQMAQQAVHYEMLASKVQ
jgi:hypothetical protein